MGFKEEFVDAINAGLGSRTQQLSLRPSVEVCPGDDDDALWVSSHQNRIRTVICNTPEFRDTPFCGAGYH